LFGSCIIHILYTGCAKIKKNNSGAKRLRNSTLQNLGKSRHESGAHKSSEHSQPAFSWQAVFAVHTRAFVHQIVLPALHHFGLTLALTIYVAVSKTYSVSDSKQQEIQELKLSLLLTLYSPFIILFDILQ
jgi:hypothetical protein